MNSVVPFIPPELSTNLGKAFKRYYPSTGRLVALLTRLNRCRTLDAESTCTPGLLHSHQIATALHWLHPDIRHTEGFEHFSSNLRPPVPFVCTANINGHGVQGHRYVDQPPTIAVQAVHVMNSKEQLDVVRAPSARCIYAAGCPTSVNLSLTASQHSFNPPISAG